MAFNILIVDDSSSMRSVIKKAIKVSGFDVGEYLMAGDGREALQVLQDEWVDLVLTDINMPHMNGLELIAAMKEDQLSSAIPVVMVSTDGSQKTISEAMALGASGYIRKPFQPEEIKGILSRIMGETGDAEGNDDEERGEGDF